MSKDGSEQTSVPAKAPAKKKPSSSRAKAPSKKKAVSKKASSKSKANGSTTKRKNPVFRPGMTRKEIAKQYTPYVRSIAGKIWKTLSKDIEFDDLVSYGMLGLLEAAERFDPKYGANL